MSHAWLPPIFFREKVLFIYLNIVFALLSTIVLYLFDSKRKIESNCFCFLLFVTHCFSFSQFMEMNQLLAD